MNRELYLRSSNADSVPSATKKKVKSYPRISLGAMIREYIMVDNKVLVINYYH